MRFGPVAVGEAEGAVLAHSTEVAGGRLRKGTVLGPHEVAALRDAGHRNVTVARLDPGDVGEDEAARTLAAAICEAGEGLRAVDVSTGRVNLYADRAGLLDITRAGVDAVNAVDPALTLATLPEHRLVGTDAMVATVKVIPFAVERRSLDRSVSLARSRAPLFVRAPRGYRVHLIQTEVAGTKASVLDKTAGRLAERLSRCGAVLAGETRIDHDTEALMQAFQAMDLRADAEPQDEMIVVFGASAIADPDDVIPAALRMAGGTVTALGMPVDPGNLLLTGRLGVRPVIGAPGCARSPAMNGFDWVLNRLTHGAQVDADFMAGLGVGGLLVEMPDRPHRRERD